MIEAMWAVQFSTPKGTFGAGVVVFETQRVFGGDSMYYYHGSYSVDRDEVRANVLVKHYAGQR